MDIREARLALLQTELKAISDGIRGLDTIIFQIKGWAVTAALAIGGVAAASTHYSLVFLGMLSTVGFFIVNCQFAGIQRQFIVRNRLIHGELIEPDGVEKYLDGDSRLRVVGTAAIFVDDPVVGGDEPTIGGDDPVADGDEPDLVSNIRRQLSGFWYEARLPHTFGLYLFMLVSLGIEAIILNPLAAR